MEVGRKTAASFMVASSGAASSELVAIVVECPSTEASGSTEYPSFACSKDSIQPSAETSATTEPSAAGPSATVVPSTSPD